MSSRKGQAAMEYLMTYGWALLALVAVIGALMATGAFNPSYLIAEECTLQPDLSCGPHVLYLDGGEPVLEFRINNGLGYPIYIEEVTVASSDGRDDYPWDIAPSSGYIDQGGNAKVTVDLSGLGAVKGETQRFKLSMVYKSCAPEVIGEQPCSAAGVEHTVSGRVVARVEEA